MSDVNEGDVWPKGRHHERKSYPTFEVANKVVWVNEKLLAPFDLHIGKPSPFGLSLEYYPELGKESRATGLRLHTRRVRHGRSADLGAIYFSDVANTRIFRDVDFKGVGRVGDKGVPKRWEDEPGLQRVAGLMEKEDAFLDTKYAEEFADLGIRTHRTIAIIELEELPVSSSHIKNAHLVSVADLKRQDELPKKFTPVVQMRAYVTKTRIGEIGGRRDETLREIADTIALLKKETNGIVHDVASYLVWFAETLGKNVGIMHAHNYTHGYVTDHNITLDSCLTDFDSVIQHTQDDKKEFNARVSRDFVYAQASLLAFVALLQTLFSDTQLPDVEKIFNGFSTAYAKAYPQNTVL